MTDRDARREMADIVRGVRALLEREGPGASELLAMAARKSAKRGTTGTRATRSGAAPSRRATVGTVLQKTPATEGKKVVGRFTPAVGEVDADLFGGTAKKPRGKTARTSVFEEETELHPIDPKLRAAIAKKAKPLLEAIAKEVERCKDCALWETRTKAVPGVGSALSGIVFVGEAPGAEEDRKGEPFVGRAGQLLDKIIQAMDDAKLIPDVELSRDTVFIGNVIHCRPPDNRVPLPFEVDRSSPFLTRQLEALQPRIICCLGKTAAEHLLGSKASLASLRGKTYRYRGAKLVVTYHPAAVLRNPDLKRPVWQDMQFLAREYARD